MLVEADIDPAEPGFLASWEVFKQFAAREVDSASDGFLFQSGIHTFTGRELLHVGYVRQFEVTDDEGDHEYYVQLRCEFMLEPTPPALERPSLTLWCFPPEGDSFEDWSSQVEATPEFDHAVHHQPIATEVIQEAV